MSEPIVLGIETSCDETGVGLVQGRILLANEVASSMQQHVRFGGVVPEIAARAHVQEMTPTLDRALAAADLDLGQVDAIAVTAGPGLMGALVVGISAAKSLALALNKPLYGVNHVVGHIAVDRLEHGEITEPTLALLVSGGHTSLLKVDDLTRSIQTIGRTIDDAAGEAYDKVARLLELPYPGGPVIDQLAATGDPQAIRFPRALTARHDLERHRFDFSFSGLKTAVARWIETQQLTKTKFNPADVAASFQEAVADVLTKKTIAAAQQHQISQIILGGGVAANSRLRQLLAERADAAGITVRRPRPELCTDNGAMIAALGAALVNSDIAPSSREFGAMSQLQPEHISLD